MSNTVIAVDKEYQKYFAQEVNFRIFEDNIYKIQRGLAEHKEDQLKEALADRGVSYSEEVIIRRVEIEVDLKGNETYYLDGCPLIMFTPVESDHYYSMADDKYFLTASCKVGKFVKGI